MEGRVTGVREEGDDLLFGMVKLTPEQQAAVMAAHPDVFEPESGAWGRAGCTKVRLDFGDDETVGEALTLAWQNIAKRAEPVKKGSQTLHRTGAAINEAMSALAGDRAHRPA